MLLCQTLASTIHEKMEKSHSEVINTKYQLQDGKKSLNYLIDHIVY